MNPGFRLPVLFVVIGLLTLASCDDDSREPEFNYFNAAGAWIIYEIEWQDGSVNTGDYINDYTIFGAYNASATLKVNRNYMPLNKMSDGTYHDEPEEAGTYEYFPDTMTLVFTKDFFVVAYTIEKYTTDDLHLSRDGQTYRLRRK